MKAAVVTFPGSNCDRDLADAFAQVGFSVEKIWHKDNVLPEGVDVVALPGGFSYGDYLRCGAIAARSPISGAIQAHAARGGYVLGICNGFQILTEMGLLPGTLMRNAGLKFICRPEVLRVESAASAFTQNYKKGQDITIPIAHHDGNYTLTPQEMRLLHEEERIAFRYAHNPNGSLDSIAGVLSANRRVLGMMPHPERAMHSAQGSADGAAFFAGLLGAMIPA